MDTSKLEIHLLALRDAAVDALVELEKIKKEAPPAQQKKVNGIAKHLEMLNTKTWHKGNRKTAQHQNQ